jgi:hypothetical protein
MREAGASGVAQTCVMVLGCALGRWWDTTGQKSKMMQKSAESRIQPFPYGEIDLTFSQLLQITFSSRFVIIR